MSGTGRQGEHWPVNKGKSPLTINTTIKLLLLRVGKETIFISR